MKTTTYNAVKEIRVLIWIFVITLSVFTTLRIKELQINEVNEREQMKAEQIELNNVGFPSLRVLDAKLINEPVLEVEAWMNNNSYWGTETVTKVNEIEPIFEVEALIYNVEYKANEYVKAELLIETERWFRNNFETNNQSVETIETGKD